MLRYLVFIILTFIIAPSFAETIEDLNITSQHFTTRNGMPSNNIRCLAQDERGYMWLGTLYGLYRFDGYNYKRIVKEDGDDRMMMANNRISSLWMWKKGILIMQFSDKSLAAYDIYKDRFLHAGTKEEMLVWYPDFKNVVGSRNSLDSMGNKFSLKGGVLTWHDPETNEDIRMDIIPNDRLSLSADFKIKVVVDRRGNPWISTAGAGLYMYDRKSRQLTHFSQNAALPYQIPYDYIIDMINDKWGNIWITMQWYGVSCITVSQKNYDLVEIASKNDIRNAREIKAMTGLGDGNILVANDYGKVMIMDKHGQCSLSNIVPQGKEYLCFSLDNEGGIIAGTRNNGLYHKDKWYEEGKRIDRIVTDRKGRIWYGSINGDFGCIEKDGTVKHFQSLTELTPEIRAMVTDKKGNVWLGTDKGIIAFSPEELLCNPNAFSVSHDEKMGRVNALLFSKNGNLWVCTATGAVFARHTNGLKIEQTLQTFNAQQNSAINAIAEDSKGNIWIGTDNGNICFSPKTNKHIMMMENSQTLINHCNANCLVPMQNGGVAIGTLEGILIADKERLMKNRMIHPLLITDIEQEENSLRVFFSDFSFTTDHTTLYNYYLEGYDEEWSISDKLNYAIYRQLPPGDYTFKVKAMSVMGGESEIQQVAIHIPRPWYQSWWSYTLYITFIAAIFAYLYRQWKREQQLKQAVHDEHLLTEYRLKFFTNISHEFRTPLTLIQGSMDKMMSIGEIPSSYKASFAMLNRSVERMRRLIDQFIEFRKMETNNLSLRLEDVEIVGYLRDVFYSFSDMAERRRINMLFSTHDKECHIFADRGCLDKILYNLISNAFKYTPVGGEIMVRIYNDKADNVCISIIDNGVGVAEDKRKELFKRYNRSHMTGDSIGIGLNLTAELVRTHHGNITYEPRPGGGSVFSFSLPLDKAVYKPEDFLDNSAIALQQEHESMPWLKNERQMNAEPMNDRTVLIVEDDKDILDYLHQELSFYFHVEVAMDGDEAIEIIEDHLPDLVLSDIVMPHKGGLALLKHIRHSAYSHLPVILLTAQDTSLQAEKSYRYGADAYISKPFSMKVLIAQCVNLLQRKDLDNNNQVTTTEHITMRVPGLLTEEADKKFLMQLERYIDSRLSNPDLSVDDIAAALGYGRTAFYKKVNALTATSPKEYVRKRRLQQAAELLKNEHITVAEVAYKCGFNTAQYFSTTFRAYYGVSPSEYHGQ